MSPVSAVCQGDVTACQTDAYLTPATAAAQTLLTSIYQNTTGHLHAATEIFHISFFQRLCCYLLYYIQTGIVSKVPLTGKSQIKSHDPHFSSSPKSFKSNVKSFRHR